MIGTLQPPRVQPGRFDPGTAAAASGTFTSRAKFTAARLGQLQRLLQWVTSEVSVFGHGLHHNREPLAHRDVPHLHDIVLFFGAARGRHQIQNYGSTYQLILTAPANCAAKWRQTLTGKLSRPPTKKYVTYSCMGIYSIDASAPPPPSDAFNAVAEPAAAIFSRFRNQERAGKRHVATSIYLNVRLTHLRVLLEVG